MENLIDSHFHLLALQHKGINPVTLLEDLFDRGFEGGIDVGIRANDIAERTQLLSAYPLIKLAAGIGPWGAEGNHPIPPMVQQFAELSAAYQVDCIGEIGLDFHWNYGTPYRQKELCIIQMELANLRACPVVIHTRDADQAMMEILDSVALSHSGILHCFSSTWELAECALEQGLYLSFAGPITYKNNIRLREILAKVPLNRLLLETDSPYLAPVPYRGEINTPHYMVEIYNEAARIKEISVTELAATIKTNFATLFRANDNCG